ncbi:hypothetical protein G9A89_019763 [Geosiphon pyriformis]|nr:hypothetical protein G9A89_019763 [Geosiphon pyriformis]
MAYQNITKLEKFSGKEDNTLAEKPTDFPTFKLAFLQYFCDPNTLIRLQNQFSIIKQKDYETVTTYLRQFNQILYQIQTIERDYYTVAQILNQFPELQKLTNHYNGEKITITADINSNKTINNSNNLGDLIPATVTTARNLDTLLRTAERRSWTKIKETNTSNQDISKACLTEDQGFDKSTPVEGTNVEQIFKPSKQTKSNILLATITENTTLAAIFLFDIDNLNTHSLFSRAAINQDKPIIALYTDARVGRIDIKLILDSKLASSIIMKQLMDQLDD